MSVRPAAPADIAAIHAIAAASPSAPQWTHAQYADILSPEPGAVVRRAILVWETAGTVAGFAVVSALTAVYPVEAELESIAVSPGLRRQGIGRALLGAVFAWCREKGVADLRLEVRAGNTNAVTLYEQCGFHRQGMRSRYYVNPTEDAVSMILSNFSRERLPVPQ